MAIGDDEITERTETTTDSPRRSEDSLVTTEERIIMQRILREREEMELTGLATGQGFPKGKQLLSGLSEETGDTSSGTAGEGSSIIGWEQSAYGGRPSSTADGTQLWQPPETGFLPPDKAQQLEHGEGGYSTVGTDKRIDDFLATLDQRTKGWKKDYSNTNAPAEDREVAKREADLQAVIDDFNKQQGLPPVEVRVVPDWWFEDKNKEGASAVYADGRILVRESQVKKGITPDFVEALYHENAHHEQTALEIRHIAEQTTTKYESQLPETDAQRVALKHKQIDEAARRYAEETGSPIRLEEMQQRLKKMTDQGSLTKEEIAKAEQAIDSERDRLQLLQKMAEHALAQNDREPLTQEQHKRAAELITAERNRNSPSDEVLKLTQKVHEGLFKAISELSEGDSGGQSVDLAEKLFRSMQEDRKNGGKFLSKLFGENGVPEETRTLLDKLDQLDREGKAWKVSEADLRQMIAALNKARQGEFDDYYNVVEQESEHIGQRAKEAYQK
jgi:hypothetical protein